MNDSSSGSDIDLDPREDLRLSEEARGRWQGGSRVELPRFSGSCLGDDVSWKLSGTLRVVGLQTAGTGRDRYVWGRWWAEFLIMLGADVGVLTETRIANESGHAAACRGLRDGGFAAVSHNCLTPPRGASSEVAAANDPRSGGVVLAIRTTHTSGWTDVAADSHGRGLAASALLANGASLRLLGLYGVTGSCLPGFQLREEAKHQEAQLNLFVRSQCREQAPSSIHCWTAAWSISFANVTLDSAHSPSSRAQIHIVELFHHIINSETNAASEIGKEFFIELIPTNERQFCVFFVKEKSPLDGSLLAKSLAYVLDKAAELVMARDIFLQGVTATLSGATRTISVSVASALVMMIWKALTSVTDRVNQTLHFFVQLARAVTGVDVQLTVMDDAGEWRRCRQNYRALARDSSIDFLLGPSFSVWEAAVKRIVHDESKLMISWVGNYPFYLTDFRTQLCPYCNEDWRTQIDWVDEMIEFQDTAFQTTLIATARPTGGRLDSSEWVIPTQPDLQNLLRPALVGAQNAVMKQLTSARNVTWGFTYFPNATRGEVSEAECRFFEEIVTGFDQATTVLLPITTYITDSFQTRREFDILVFCGSTNAFGQAMVKAQALNWRFEALLMSFASGTRSLFRYGAGFVNYMAEPLAVPAVLPNATDAILESFDALALAVGFEPDMASLQAASAASLLVQAVQASPSLSSADVRDTIRNTTFQTLFGPFGYDSSGNRLLQPFAFRQFLPSNIIPLQEAGVQLKRGEMNSNIVLVSPEILEVCRGDNSSVLCRDIVLEHMEFPMPAAAARYRQAYMCPDGTSLEGTNCVACARGFYRAGEMVSCEPCPAGTFSDFPGAGVCRECPNVAMTCQPDAKPVIMSGFFVFEGEFAWLSTTGFEPIKLMDFAFLMSGYYSLEDPANLTKYTLEVPVTRGLSECAQLCSAADDEECVGLLFIIERARCVFYREGAQYFPWVADNRTLLYLREVSPFAALVALRGVSPNHGFDSAGSDVMQFRRTDGLHLICSGMQLQP
ncbi:unnamed protein product [Symbiodinium sp. CCMP2592]|nr:unnamed protein product [Symbiodinium sp. CCMP2592]